MNVSPQLKHDLVAQLLAHFANELESLRRSADAAAVAATHPENKPENKYDTRGLEASYLAGAQRARSLEIESAIQLLNTIAPRAFSDADPIAVTALVELDDAGQSVWYFLMTVGAGYPLVCEGKPVMTITPQSPIGQALLGKLVGDVITVRTAQGKKNCEIVALR